ncbi:MAG: type II toxin-antitoxin system VapC family toxin [Brachybacterium sp.]|uniref:type II toxin-antitoxin system VapC family toxin n=1 Tax=unclassified Brachybacterium TaxID=2623841 RepID=UPI003F8FB8B5
MIHLDTSALAKLLVEEPESDPLRAHLVTQGQAGTQFAISTIATVELRRLAIRLGLEASRVEPVLRPFHTLRLTEGILALAGRLSFPHLGTLDAIHVATALTAEAGTLLTYDTRQAEAAAIEGLTILSPA